MKKINKTVFFVTALCFTSNAFSQNLNWENLKPETKHLVNINVGWDYGLVFGVGYGYQLKTKFPIVLNIAYSVPAGENLLDDYKLKIGGQIRLIKIQNFGFSANVHGVFRRYENPLVRMLNFGSDFSGVVGYYKPKWFIAGEAGFDKAIVTHIKNSSAMKDIYPAVQDGWYVPTGGNFFYGIQTGFSLKSNDLNLKIGKTITQDFKTTASLPVYLQLGFNRRF